MVLQGSYLYTNQGPRLVVVDVSVPARPEVRGTFPGVVNSIAVRGEFLYAAVGASGLWVLDVSDPTNPRAVGHRETNHVPWGMEAVGTLLYTATMRYGLEIFDISNPGEPVPVGSWDTPGSACDLALAGRYAYGAAWSGGLRVIDVGDPRAPR